MCRSASLSPPAGWIHPLIGSPAMRPGVAAKLEPTANAGDMLCTNPQGAGMMTSPSMRRSALQLHARRGEKAVIWRLRYARMMCNVRCVCAARRI